MFKKFPSKNNRERSREKTQSKYAEKSEDDDSNGDDDDPFGANAELLKRKQLRQQIINSVMTNIKPNSSQQGQEESSQLKKIQEKQDKSQQIEQQAQKDNSPQQSSEDQEQVSEHGKQYPMKNLTVLPSIERQMVFLDPSEAKFDKQLPATEQTTKPQQKSKQNTGEEDFDMFDDQVLKQQLHDNPTTPEAYYKSIPGEIMNSRYRVIDKIGKGVFGTVVKAVDQSQSPPKQVAIKILRQIDMLAKSGQKEYALLSKLKGPHIIACYQQFFHRGHYCLVFELMQSDLRAVIKTSTSSLNLDLIRSWALQMFLALHSMRKQRLVHADIKPDNMLASKDLKTIKLCDFGTSFPVEEGTVVEYLVARYYRAPDIILGCPLDLSLDTWSIGCTLYQLFTGEFMFPGRSNNQVLKYIMQMKGKFSLKMLKKGLFTAKHFDTNYNFLEKVLDANTQQYVTRSVVVTKTADRELMSLLKRKAGLSVQHKKLANFKDFLEQCTALNPKHRLTPEKALEHPFINYQMKLS